MLGNLGVIGLNGVGGVMRGFVWNVAQGMNP